mmetsp:Transcript_98848/g.262476  ORF Transcript_98848/g.262476 Transcript_98848/m.262476 type:complete len:300 (-) Transcript_98848:9-908(-)
MRGNGSAAVRNSLSASADPLRLTALTQFSYDAGSEDGDRDLPPCSWDDELTERDFEDLRQTIRNLHPKFKPAGEQLFEHDLRTTVRKRLTVRNYSDSQLRPRDHELITSQHLNARLIFAEQPFNWEREGAQGPAHVPKLIIVSGHLGNGGNVGINGIYERYPDDYNGRPAYQKFMEKGPPCDPSETRVNRRTRANQRDFGFHSPRTRILMDRYERVAPLPPLPAFAGHSELQAAKSAWFLYFYEGYWTIGPKVGSREAFARSPGADLLVPYSLLNWEVWDIGMKRFAKSKGLRAVKGGN